MMKTHCKDMLRQAAVAVALTAGLAAVPAGAEEQPKVKLGLVSFLSGGAAGPFGIPARNAAELLVGTLNAGSVPAPYGAVGIAGAAIQVTEYRNLVERQGADAVIGYISSGDCNAIAPVVEELKRLTVFFDCGTPQVFEEIVTSPKYLFRTGATATMDSVGAARYLVETAPDIQAYAGINQNYAWGQDSWNDFAAAMAQLKPQAEVKSEQFPKIYAGQYGTEISALLTSGAEAIHSSFWGGDMEAFILQGSARGLFQKSRIILTTGETATHRLGARMPDGTIIGARGPHGDFAPDSELNSWFRQQYFDRYGTWPTYPSYKMAQAILGLKSASEKAAAAKGGARPTQEEVIAAFESLEYTTPSGTVSMALANGHQAVQDTAYGTYKYDRDSGRASYVDVKRYPIGCVNPPAGSKSIDWITAGFPGAKC